MAKRDLTIIIRGRDRAKKAFRSVAAGLTRMANVVKKGALVIAAAAAAAIAATALAVKSAFARLDVLAKTIDKLGMTSEALAGLGLAAQLTGVNVEKLAPTLAKMMKNIAEVARGSGEASKAFDSLGLNAKALNKLTPDEQFFAIADAMGDVESQSDKVLFAMELFGKQGASLLNTMDLGEERLRELQKTAKRFRLAPSRKELAGVEAFNDAWLLVKQMFLGVANTIAIEIAPKLQRLSESMTDNSDKLFAAVDKGIVSVTAAWSTATAHFQQAKDLLSGAVEKMGLHDAWTAVMKNYKTVFDFLSFTIDNWQLSLSISLGKAEVAIRKFRAMLEGQEKFKESKVGLQVVKEWFGKGTFGENLLTPGMQDVMRGIGTPKNILEMQRIKRSVSEMEEKLTTALADDVKGREVPGLSTVTGGEGVGKVGKGKLTDWAQILKDLLAGQEKEKSLSKTGGAVGSPQMQMSRFLTGVMESTQGKRLDELKKEVKRGSDKQEEATAVLSRMEDRMLSQPGGVEVGIFA
jgi:hypothetical protein